MKPLALKGLAKMAGRLLWIEAPWWGIGLRAVTLQIVKPAIGITYQGDDRLCILDRHMYNRKGGWRLWEDKPTEHEMEGAGWR